MGWRPVQEIILSHIEGGMLNKKEFRSRQRLLYPIIQADRVESFKNGVKVSKSFCRPAGARPYDDHGHGVSGRWKVAVVLRQPVAAVGLLLRRGERSLGVGARRLLLLSTHLLHLLLVQHCILAFA